MVYLALGLGHDWRRHKVPQPGGQPPSREVFADAGGSWSTNVRIKLFGLSSTSKAGHGREKLAIAAPGFVADSPLDMSCMIIYLSSD